MTSSYSTSLRLELMATGDQSGTWGDTTNTNLGTLLEQAITGVLSVAQGDTTLTLTSLNGASDQARNAVINLTGALTADRNVVVPTANKLYLVKNSTTGGFTVTVKTAAGSGVSIGPTTSQWVYCDGTNVVQGLTGSTNITGGTITGITQFTMASGVASPATNDAAALGSGSLSWSDLFLASGAVVNWANGDVTLTHSANTLAFAGASSGYTFDVPIALTSGGTGASTASGARTAFGLGTSAVLDITTTAQYLANTSSKVLTTDQVNAAGAIFALTDGATVNWDMASGFNASLTIAGNRTLANPTNTIVGRTGAIVITQASGGSHTLAYGVNWEAAGGTFPVLSTAASAKDVIFYWIQSSSSIVITGILKAVA